MVDAVAKYPVPETEKAVDDAYVNRLSPVNELLLVSSVEDAAATVMLSPLPNVVPLIVPKEPVMYEEPTEVVATTTPLAFVERRPC